MNTWSREERYQSLDDVTPVTLEALKEQVASSAYRQTYHIQPETGLLNHPSGLTFYQGTYYVSHQWFPLGAVHGLKYWFNYTSKDLVHFEPQGPLIQPDSEYDSHGAFSGSAFQYNGELYYMYTGNHRDKEWKRNPSQMLAKMDSKGSINKFPKPVISGAPTGYTDQLRDPKVFQKDNSYYAILGAQNIDYRGRLLLYRTEDIVNWQFLGEVKTQLDHFGSLWECPDYFDLDGHDVLLFCSQRTGPDGERGRKSYQSGYVIGQFDIEQLSFNHGEFNELDHGYDFYAPQTFVDESGNRVLIGWMGMPATTYPTDDEGWAHCLTLPRILNIEEGQLKQRPIPQLKKLRRNKETALGYANKFERQLMPYDGTQYELIIDILDNEATELYFELRTSKDESTLISYNTHTQHLSLDRSESGALPKPVEVTNRTTRLVNPLTQLHIFVDTSSIEIFCNDGERVLSSRIFPSKASNGIKASTESGQVYLKFTKYELSSDAQQEG
ncbi:sucrose-6-phosphate hydrolase [Staphylococcus sp. SQ8-PEA]|uniref:Sucrose-6-phosphate hydrolase n=1 Tax=Staphylococcus marylandisciuri TaxID=2981529 RepID=A0ABT2QQA7_9STAP|nr:sucrose-6-phosphate hydrolase [Staphylococcus marylandisciuri]MCU5746158.1 sucrose-6-phosphate hydrolase [Staphylococcus marylandisciuri]